MPVIDILNNIQNVIQIAMQATQVLGFAWLLSGGLIYLVRTISFILDGLIVNFIAAVYKYFTQLLEGTMFNEAVVDAVMKNVYVFIGVIVFFRLAMLILKYIVSPELIEDGKMGANKLVKRVILGMIGIIVIPTIFDFSLNIQSAFLKDQVIQKLIVPEDLLEVSEKKMDDAGKFIGTYVWAGFMNPATKAPKNVEKEFKSALKKGDLSSLDVNKGGFLGMGYDVYDYNYFIFLSTFVLGSVLFLMIKYCLDLIGRLFKLFLYQLIAPIAMIEYMINGSDDGVFKSWKNAVLGTYFLLFVRVFALWFVIFVMTLMSGDLPNTKYTNGSLLATDDYLLRAMIMLALLGFMMDLPKLFSNIFGIDLEQQGSAGGLLDSVKGMFGKVAGAGLAMGGAALGGLAGAAKGGLGSANALAAKKAPTNAAAQRYRAKADKLGTWKTTGMGSIKGALGSMTKSGMGVSGVTQSAYGAYAAYTEVGKAGKDENDKELAKAAQKEKEAREADLYRREVARDRRETVKRVYNSPSGETMSPEELAKTSAQLEIDAKLTGVDLSALQAALNASISGGESIQLTTDKVMDGIGERLGFSPKEVEQVVKMVYKDPGVPKMEKGTRIVDEIEGRARATTTQAMQVEVNEVKGHRVVDSIATPIEKVEKVTQTIHRDFVDNTQAIKDGTQVIHRDFVDNTQAIKDETQVIHRDVVNNIRVNSTISNKMDVIDKDVVEGLGNISDSLGRMDGHSPSTEDAE